MPSGATLSKAIFEIPDNWQKKRFPPIKEPADVVYAAFYVRGSGEPALRYPTDRVQSIFTCRRDGALHGAAATFNEDGRLQTLAFYVNGKLHGSLSLWNENGERRFCGQYKNGKKDGLVCFFENGKLQLIQECCKGKTQESYLVQLTEDDPSVLPSGQLSGDNAAKMNKALDNLKKLEDEIARNERKLKSKLKTWVRRWQVTLQARQTSTQP